MADGRSVETSIPKAGGAPAPIWQKLRFDAKLAAEQEPSLSSYLAATVLNHETFAEALCYQLAQKAGGPDMSALAVREICEGNATGSAPLFSSSRLTSPRTVWRTRPGIPSARRRDSSASAAARATPYVLPWGRSREAPALAPPALPLVRPPVRRCRRRGAVRVRGLPSLRQSPLLARRRAMSLDVLLAIPGSGDSEPSGGGRR